MKKIIRDVDSKRGIVQITISDERWYTKSTIDSVTELPIHSFVPSVTWIASFYPKGIHFYKWLADKGWDEAEAIKNAAGNRGSKVHLAIADILLGKEVRIDSKYLNKDLGTVEELELEEIECIQSFLDWRKDNPGEVIAFEVAVFSEKYGYAGTVDLIYKTEDGVYWLIDLKTGQSIWTEYELQVSAYRECIINGENGFQKLPPAADLKLAILQLGYKLNKKGYKFTEIEQCFDMFLTAKHIWQREAGNQSPKKRDYPIILSPGLKDDGLETRGLKTNEEVRAIVEQMNSNYMKANKDAIINNNEVKEDIKQASSKKTSSKKTSSKEAQVESISEAS